MDPQALTLAIDGMTCGHCVRAVENALAALPGVTVDHVEIGRADVRVDPEQTTRAALAEAIEAEGYTARLVGSDLV